jgi:hypothetical protein
VQAIASGRSRRVEVDQNQIEQFGVRHFGDVLRGGKHGNGERFFLKPGFQKFGQGAIGLGQK